MPFATRLLHMASNSPAYERRTCAYQVRIDGGGETPEKISGHAAVFDSSSEEMGGLFGSWREEIRAGAFDDVLKDDVRALLNHDPNFIYARTTNGTLRLSVDKKGLFTEADPLPTQTIRDMLIEPLKRGDLNQMSFGFNVAEEHEETRDDRPMRVIDRIGRLFDISVVTYPAYPATDAQARSLLAALHVDVDSLSTPERAAVRSFITSVAKHLPSARHMGEPGTMTCAHDYCRHPMDDHMDGKTCEHEDGCEMFAERPAEMSSLKLPVAQAQAGRAPADTTPLAGVSAKVRSRLLELQDRDFALSVIERK